MIYRAYPFTNNRCNSIIPNFSFELFLLVALILQIQDDFTLCLIISTQYDTINILNDEFCLILNRDNPSYFPMYNMFRIWNKIVRKNRNVEIAKKNFIYDYTENTITNNIGIVI